MDEILKIFKQVQDELGKRHGKAKDEKRQAIAKAYHLCDRIKEDLRRKEVTPAEDLSGLLIKNKTYRWSELQKTARYKDYADTTSSQVFAEIIGEFTKPTELAHNEKISVIEGEKITEAYAEEYLGSCMYPERGHPGSKYLSAYGKSNVKMIILRRETKLIARALMWDTLNEKGELIRYFDRRYGTSAAERVGRIMEAVAKAYGATHQYIRQENAAKDQGLMVMMEFEKGLPYIDSFSVPVAKDKKRIILKQGKGVLQALDGSAQTLEKPNLLFKGQLSREIGQTICKSFEEKFEIHQEKIKQLNKTGEEYLEEINNKKTKKKKENSS